MKVLHICLIGMLIWSVNCAPKEQEVSHAEPMVPDFEIENVVTAKQNVETVCLACHHPTASPQDRLAPPLIIAKRNYLAKTNSREEFVNKMVKFILYPTQEESMLHSDVEQYGLMDPVGFSEEDVRAIAEYIYDTNLEKPDWLKGQD